MYFWCLKLLLWVFAELIKDMIFFILFFTLLCEFTIFYGKTPNIFTMTNISWLTANDVAVCGLHNNSCFIENFVKNETFSETWQAWVIFLQKMYNLLIWVLSTST